MPTSTTTCCPPDPSPSPSGVSFVYVDSTGHYRDPSTSINILVTNYAGNPASACYNKCVHVQTASAFGELINPIPCPCCPDTFPYYYNQSFDLCMPLRLDGTYIATRSVPCIECICLDPPPPPECETCNEQGGRPISFHYNPFVKVCKDCVPQDLTLPSDPKLNCFMPYFIILPNTNNFTTE